MPITFSKLKATNFMRYKNLEVDLDNQGVVLLSGKTGAGKSSIVDALVWGLFGKTTRGVKSVASPLAKGKNCFAEVEVNINGNRIFIKRYQKHSQHKNNIYIESKVDDLRAQDKIATQERIHTILGYDFPLFLNTVVAGQYKDLPGFSTSTDSNRKKLLDFAMQMHRYEIAAKLVRQDMGEIEENVSALSKEKEITAESRLTLQSQLDSIKTALASLKKPSGETSELKLQIAELKHSLKEIEPIMARHKKRIETLRKSRGDHASQLAVFKIMIADNKKKISQLQEELHFYHSMDRCNTCLQEIDSDFKESKFSSLTKEMNVETVALDSTVKKQQETSAVERRESEAIRSLESKLEKLRLEESGLNRRLSVRRQELASTEAKIEGYETQKSELKKQRNKITAKLEELEKLSVAIETESGKRDKKLGYLKPTLNLVGPKGISTAKYAEALPAINAGISKVLDVMTNGDIKVKLAPISQRASGKEVNEIGLEVVNHTGANSYLSSSGGEREIVDLAIMIGLSELATSQGREEILLRIYDESFGFLDSELHELVIELLQDQVKRYKTILCVSHQSEFKDQFPNILHVIKKAGESRVAA